MSILFSCISSNFQLVIITTFTIRLSDLFGRLQVLSQLPKRFFSTLIHAEGTEYIAIEDWELGVDVKCCASPYWPQQCKGLLCYADPSVDFFVEVARFGDFAT